MFEKKTDFFLNLEKDKRSRNPVERNEEWKERPVPFGNDSKYQTFKLLARSLMEGTPKVPQGIGQYSESDRYSEFKLPLRYISRHIQQVCSQVYS